MARSPSFSIVVNTLNRGTELQVALESFRWLKYAGDFEVVVVNGPSTDSSDLIIERWLPSIRAEKCAVANLSVSRNIGICMARGDVIAFIDDDAIPEPEWLTQLAEPYSDPLVGAVGGFVYNHTGYDFQYKFCLVDRFGNADFSPVGPSPHLSFPGSNRIPHLLGCNSSFRRSALLEIRGFDEEFEYFLDETDVCTRLVDAGYIIAQIPCAYVHHKYAPSNIRGDNKVARYRYPVIKNKIYFTLKHARDFYPLEAVLKEQESFIQSQRNEVDWALRNQLLSQSDIDAFRADLSRARKIGRKRGFEGVVDGAMIDDQKLELYSGQFCPFTRFQNPKFKSIVFILRDFPSNSIEPAATFTKYVAEALAAEGHIVHIITQSYDINRVDWENGVWLHRMILREAERSREADGHKVPKRIWDWSATALAEAKRIGTHRPIDVVEAPIGDCEGVAFMFDGRWPLVSSLDNTLSMKLESHPELRAGEEWMESFGKPMLAIEKELMFRSKLVRSTSASDVRDIEAASGLKFDSRKVCIVPPGLPNLEGLKPNGRNCDATTVLYVGTLEDRAEIETLLAAVPLVLEKNDQTRFHILGVDYLISSQRNVKVNPEHLASDIEPRYLSQVTIECPSNLNELHPAYESCDLFVGPSRFPSFGFAYLEAMRAAKPVIGSLSGKIAEIISADVTGLLVSPGDCKGLADAIIRLVQSEAVRTQIGNAGRRVFIEKYTSKSMAQSYSDGYRLLEENLGDTGS